MGAEGSYRRLGIRMGVHSARVDDAGTLVVDWYNFGEDVAYEYVSRMTFDPSAARAFAAALGIPDANTPSGLLGAVGDRFEFFFDIEAFAKRHGIPFARTTDFRP